MDRFLEMIQSSLLLMQPLHLSIFVLIVMARCQLLGRESEDFYEGGPSMNHCLSYLPYLPSITFLTRVVLTGMKYQ